MDSPTAQASIEIGASPERVYELVSNVVEVPKWAEEIQTCTWKGGATGPSVGAKFRGRNKHTWRRWSTTCKVTAAEPGRRFAYQVYSGGVRSAEWEYEIEPTDEGCRVTERTKRQVPKALATAVNRFGLGIPDRDEHNQRNIESTLARLKEYAEQPTP